MSNDSEKQLDMIIKMLKKIQDEIEHLASVIERLAMKHEDWK